MLFFTTLSIRQILRKAEISFISLIKRLAQTRLVSLIRNRFPFKFIQRHIVPNPYNNWLEVNFWNERRQEVLQQALLEVQTPPKISLVMPVFNPLTNYFQRTLESVAGQIYPHWELCLANDASTDPEVYKIIESWQGREPRLKVKHGQQNLGISGATNAAAAMAENDYLFFLDHDDELTPDALAEAALCLGRHPQTDVFYSDEDKIDKEGHRSDPHFKPDWSPELLLSYMYMAHLFGVRRDLYQTVGGMRAGFEGAQDYDLALRLTERTSKVWHLPKILYHWRITPGSTALSGHEKPYSFEAGRRAVQEAFERRGLNASIRHPGWAEQAGCGIFTHEFPDIGPSVAILIPTRNQRQLLQACLDSLSKTSYQNYQVYIIDNDSNDPDTLDYLQGLPHPVWRLSCPDGKFSFAYLINRAAAKVSEDYLLLLNNDMEVLSHSWLSQMVGYLGIPGVGTVGARLLFPDGCLQHGGVLHGMHLGKPGHAFKLMSGGDWGYQAYAKVTRNYSAVTAACMLTPRNLFQQLGGFDGKNFAVAYNDVDYCYRLMDLGYRNVYCPSAELVHHEGASRGTRDNLSEEVAFLNKYRNRQDPYYNPNLSLKNGNFSISARTGAPESLRPIRALLCTHNLNCQGAPNTLLELTQGMRARGIIEPIIHSPMDGPLRQAFEEANISVWISPLPLTAVKNLKSYSRIVDNFARDIVAKDVELLFGNTLLTFYTIAAAERLGLPCLWNIHESDPEEHFLGLPRVVAHQMLKYFSLPYQVIFGSEATQAIYQSFQGHNNFLTIHTILDYERFDRQLQPWPRDAARRELGLQPDEVMVLLVGTICERKGQSDLFLTLPLLNKACLKKVKFFLVGDRPSPYSRKIHAAYASLDQAWRSRVTIVPETKAVGLYFRAADAFLCTSRIECFPRVLLEAMYCRLAIITTPVFGVTEMVQDASNARYYPPGDCQRLARLIEILIREPAERQRLGDNAALSLSALPAYDDILNSYGKLFREGLMTCKPRTGRAQNRIASA